MVSTKQLDIVRKLYPILPNDEIATIANVSVATIRKYAKRWNLGDKKLIGGKNREWTTEEIEFLIATNDAFSLKQKAEKLGRTEKAVAVKMSKLKLNPKMGRKPITLPPSSMQWLIDNYPYRTNNDLAKHLDIKVSTVRYLAKRLGLTKWTRKTTNTNTTLQ